MREYFYNGQIRLDWGFDNPNVTGSLIALIMLAVWSLCYLPRVWGKAGFWIALMTNAALGVFLVQTFSRGAAVAWLAGAVILICYAPRPWLIRRFIAVVILSTGLILYATNLGFSDRTLQGMSGEDKSVTNRWLIYKVVPRMAWDAAEGWGHGRGGEAFRQWYQPVERTETYGRLVNSHATWLVEWPWYLRLGYGLAWASVLLVCMPSERMRFSPTLAVWVSFGLGASFTTIAHHWQLWIVPGISILLLLFVRIRLRSWPGKKHFKCAGIAWVLLVLTWWTWALCTPSRIQMVHGMVVVHGNAPQTTVLLYGLDETVMGKFYGHRIRERCATESLQLFVRWSPSAVDLPEADVVVLAGKVSEEVAVQDHPSLAKAKRWLLLNPDQPCASLLELMDVERPPPVTIQVGALVSGTGRYFWPSFAAKHPNHIKIEEISGRGRFLRDWSRSKL